MFLSELEIKLISVLFEDIIDYLEIIGYISGQNYENSSIKRDFLKRIISTTLTEICETGTFHNLIKELETEVEEQALYQKKQTKFNDIQKKISEIRKSIFNLKVIAQKELDILENEVLTSKLELEETEEFCSIEIKFTNEECQHNIQSTKEKMAFEEDRLRDNIQAFRDKIDMENKVNKTLKIYLEDAQMELSEEIKKIKKKFEYDGKRNDTNIQKLQNGLNILTENLQAMSNKCDLYAKVISEDKMEKMIAQQKREEEITMNRVITNLQAWWRGIMVRKGIGPYAKKKKKKKATKKDTQRPKNKEDKGMSNEKLSESPVKTKRETQGKKAKPGKDKIVPAGNTKAKM